MLPLPPIYSPLWKTIFVNFVIFLLYAMKLTSVCASIYYVYAIQFVISLFRFVDNNSNIIVVNKSYESLY